MSTINLLARTCTLFTTTKALDEDACRESLERFVKFRVGPFLAGDRDLVNCRARRKRDCVRLPRLGA